MLSGSHGGPDKIGDVFKIFKAMDHPENIPARIFIRQTLGAVGEFALQRFIRQEIFRAAAVALVGFPDDFSAAA